MKYDIKGCKIKNSIVINELITISEQKFYDGYFFKGESHNFYEVVCVLKGTVGITAEKNIFVLSNGQMTIHRPMEFHAIWEHDNSNPTCIIFSFSASSFPKIKSHIYNLSDELMYDIENLYKQSSNIFDIVENTEDISPENMGKAYFSNGIIVSAIKDNTKDDFFRFVKKLEIFLSAALESLSDIDIQYKDTSSEHYSKILEIMIENIDANITMSDLSKLCGMSISLIEKTVHKYLRCGTMTYYNNMRMNKAYTLLSNGESVKNVAISLGFSTQHHFSASFKKHFGCPPSAIKNISSNK